MDTASDAAGVDRYLAALPPDQRVVLEQVRAAIKAAVPDAQEAISYNMPAVKLKGKFFVSYCAFKRHFSVFPASEGVRKALGAEIEPYLSGRGTIRFSYEDPPTASMVTRIVHARLEEVAAEAG